MWLSYCLKACTNLGKLTRQRMKTCLKKKGIISKKSIKALSIIGIVGDEKFRPVSTHIKAALNFKDKEFDKAIKLLKEKSIVAQRESSEFVLLTANGVDVQNSVNNFVNSKAIKMNRCE